MTEYARPRAVGFNHVALEVGDIEEALAFYGRLFRFELRGKSDTMAFIDLGDQFIALQKGRRQPADDGRHVGLVVDDKEAARKALDAAGVVLIGGPFLDFRDPCRKAGSRGSRSRQIYEPRISSGQLNKACSDCRSSWRTSDGVICTHTALIQQNESLFFRCCSVETAQSRLRLAVW